MANSSPNRTPKPAPNTPPTVINSPTPRPITLKPVANATPTSIKAATRPNELGKK